jgi:predicted ArsR family transcriptional regulator
MKKNISRFQSRHRRLARSLAAIGFVSQGSVFARAKGRPGSRYQWTWKDSEQKTRSLTLSADQYAWLRKAIANQRKVDRILEKMRRLTQRIVVEHLPGPSSRKSLSIKSLALN